MEQDEGEVPIQRVAAVERALTILDAFSEGAATLTLADLAHRTGLYRSTILRLAASLERFGYLRRGGDGRFRLGPSLWRLGVLYQSNFNLADHVRPALKALVTETGETAAFYVREGDKRICLYRENAQRLVRHHLEEGAQLPLDVGASARILVAFTGGEGAFYDEIRARGVYVSRGERDPETTAVAAPVFGADGRLIGALGVAGSRARLDDHRIEPIVQAVVDAARTLSVAIGG